MIQTDSDFLKFAFSKYDNPHLSSIAEFESDLKRFTYLNSLLSRYRTNKEDLQHRLIINHIIILSNCFSVAGVLKMFDYKIIPENIATLETFLFYLEMIAKTREKIDFYLLDILNE